MVSLEGTVDRLAPPPPGLPAGTAARAHAAALGQILFLAAHVPLGLLMFAVSSVATAHAVVTVTVALFRALVTRSHVRVAQTVAYIAAADVLWRQCQADVFYETGKYAVVAVLLVSGIRTSGRRPQLLPVLYFLLLLPSIVYTLSTLEATEARQMLSFNLSGPLAIMVCCWYFSRVRLPAARVHQILHAFLGPAVALASISLYAALTSGSGYRADSSNFGGAGIVGPNQVSAILGLGAFLAFFLLLDNRRRGGLRTVFVGLIVLFAAQSALTFSRGGLLTAGVACTLAAVFHLRNPRSRLKVAMLVALFSAIAYFAVIPQLEEFTGGTLSARYSSLDTSGRAEIAQSDLDIWRENFVLGVGPGCAAYARKAALRLAAPHTEFLRLLAEHGLLGLGSAIVLILMSFRTFLRARRGMERAMAASFACWALIFMTHSALRIVAPALLLGMIFMRTTEPAKAPARTPAPR